MHFQISYARGLLTTTFGKTGDKRRDPRGRQSRNAGEPVNEASEWEASGGAAHVPAARHLLHPAHETCTFSEGVIKSPTWHRTITIHFNWTKVFTFIF